MYNKGPNRPILKPRNNVLLISLLINSSHLLPFISLIFPQNLIIFFKKSQQDIKLITLTISCLLFSLSTTIKIINHLHAPPTSEEEEAEAYQQSLLD